MNGFLHRLVERTLGQGNVVRPRLEARFAVRPVGPVDEDVEETRNKALLREHDIPLAAGEVQRESRIVQAAPRLTESERAERHAKDLRVDAGMGELSRLPAESERALANDDSAKLYGEAGVRPVRSTVHSEEPKELTQKHVYSRVNSHSGATPEEEPAASHTVGQPASMQPSPSAPRRNPATLAFHAAEVIEGHAMAAHTREAFITGADDIFGTTESELASPAPLAPNLAGPGYRGRSNESAAYGSKANATRAERESVADETIVNVTIGRIEVRSAVEPPIRTVRREAPVAPEPRDQLDAYLRARRASGR
jgi:hypothetical protein